jgi:Ca2+-binding EF-hand superfamily protein
MAATGAGEALEVYTMTQTALAALKAKAAMQKAAKARQANGSSEEADLEEMAAMRELYASIDADGSGSLSRREVLKLLKAMGEAMTPKEVTQAMRIMDPTRSGNVDFHGFHAWWVGRSDTEKAQALSAKAWAAVDVDGDGTLDPSEFKDVLERLGQADDMSQEDYLSLMQELDQDGDGVLDRQEFMQWFGSLVDAGKTTLDEMTARFEAAEAARIEVEQALKSGGAPATEAGAGMNDNPLFGGLDKDDDEQEDPTSPTSLPDLSAVDPTGDGIPKKKKKKKKKKMDYGESVILTENPIAALDDDDDDDE